MLKILVSTVILAVSMAQGADSLYSKTQALFQNGSVPSGTNVQSEEALAGKCVSPDQPMVFQTAGLYFHLQQDEVLGRLFYMVPLLRIAPEDVVFERIQANGLQSIQSGQIGSTVSLSDDQRSWTSQLGSPNRPSAYYSLRQTVGANGKVAFVLEDMETDSEFFGATYCYFTDVLVAGQSGNPGNPVVTPPPPAHE